LAALLRKPPSVALANFCSTAALLRRAAVEQSKQISKSSQSRQIMGITPKGVALVQPAFGLPEAT
jgi:hypothetical protein